MITIKTADLSIRGRHTESVLHTTPIIKTSTLRNLLNTENLRIVCLNCEFRCYLNPVLVSLRTAVLCAVCWSTLPNYKLYSDCGAEIAVQPSLAWCSAVCSTLHCTRQQCVVVCSVRCAVCSVQCAAEMWSRAAAALHSKGCITTAATPPYHRLGKNKKKILIMPRNS